MKQLLTLVNTYGFGPQVETEAPDFLRAQGAEVLSVRRFGPALDVEFAGEIQIEDALAWQAWLWKVDYAIQSPEFRRKKLLVSDMESTLVENEFLDDLAALSGVGEQVREITSRAMNGEIDFAGALRERLALLQGKSARLLETAWAGLRFMPGARELIATLRSQGVPTVIVSGGFRFYTSRVRALLGAERDMANDLEIVDGCFTGRPLGPILGKENKQRLLEETAAEMGISLEETLAVGDGANDLPMLLRAGLGVAYHAKPSVAAAAKCRVTFSDLKALLYFQGYSPELIYRRD